MAHTVSHPAVKSKQQTAEDKESAPTRILYKFSEQSLVIQKAKDRRRKAKSRRQGC
jgi:hypothetical protein